MNGNSVPIVSIGANSLFSVVNGDESGTPGKRTRSGAHVSEERLKIARRFAEITSPTSCTVTQKTRALSLASEQNHAPDRATTRRRRSSKISVNGGPLINQTLIAQRPWYNGGHGVLLPVEKRKNWKIRLPGYTRNRKVHSILSGLRSRRAGMEFRFTIFFIANREIRPVFNYQRRWSRAVQVARGSGI